VRNQQVHWSDGASRQNFAQAIELNKEGPQIELTVADDGVGMRDRDWAKIPEKRGSNCVAIFARQLGGTVVPSGSEETGTIVSIRLALLLVPPGDRERVAA
jgi:two-component sensor histidine kinase